jgi:NAD(P)-dependent dehydrogenase (short-subunit alcohol dehydrogenase family)
MANVREQGSYAPRLDSPSTGVVITGGASGLGLASAHALAAVGRPVALWDINEAGVISCAEDIQRAYGVASVGLRVDLRDAAAIRPAVAASRAALGTIGGVLHSAGTVTMTNIEGVTLENWESGINLHLRALILLVQATLPDLKAHPGSAIAAFASINATLGAGSIPIYTAAKAGVIGLVRSMADELGRDNIRINAISPGPIDTPIVEPAFKFVSRESFERRIQLGRFGRAEEVGRLVRFLLSDEASYITAAEIVIDGGNLTSQRT